MSTLYKIRKRAASEDGFTLIELLVVILIIGILAAIALPSFLNQREKGQDADAKATAKTAATAMETYATDNGGSYASATLTSLDAIEASLPSSGVTVTSTQDTYSIVVTSKAGNPAGTFTISRAANGDSTRSCSRTGKGGCNSSGSW